MKELLLGIDIGTSACKAAIFDINGKLVASTTGDYDVYYVKDGWVEQNPSEWWDAVVSAVKRLITETI